MDNDNDDDYVDDSFLTKDDVANAEEDMKSLKDEISDDDITKPDYSRVTATTNQKDAKGAATNEEEEGAAAVMPGTVNEDEDDCLQYGRLFAEVTDTPVDAGVTTTDTAEARTPVSSAQDGDDDTVADYIL
ncbi:hypothetical protein PInf_017128 [Phytophthora infestans]|nr:hypothetical protein PInf_017128 [Phytophthora infestans]